MPLDKKITPNESRLTPLLHNRLREVGLLITGSVAIFLFLALISFHPSDPSWSQTGHRTAIFNYGGKSGAWFADVLLYLFGLMAYLLPLLIGYFSWWVYRLGLPKEREHMAHIVTLLKVVGFLLIMLAGSGLAHMHFMPNLGLLPETGHPGGVLGYILTEQWLERLFGLLGTTLIFLTLFLTAITLMTGLSWIWLMDTTGDYTLRLWDWLKLKGSQLYSRWQDRKEATEVRKEREVVIEKEIGKQEKRKPLRIEPVIVEEERISVREERERQIPIFEPLVAEEESEILHYEPSVDEEGLPQLSLLDRPPTSRNQIDPESLEAISRLVEIKLKDFNIRVEVESANPGPVITRYEMQLAPGVKVSQISNLSKDLARSLSTASVRVVEVIPGKTTVGLEIPNKNREIVYLSEIFRSAAYENAKSPLAIGLGKDISGKAVVADIGKMPHMLVAGTTGSGKSVFINTLILSLLFNASPKEVRMIMVDPKMLELSIYDGIPHLLAPVVTDMKDAANALRWGVAEMERRYKLMAKLGVRNLAGCNKKIKEAIKEGSPIQDPFFQPDPLIEGEQFPANLETLPYIVIVIDELADMMMVVGKKVEELIARLAQKARASGIHLVLATQRPSVDVLTGLIKANIPSRIAFQVSSKIDSRTVLDQMGAESLLGHGDMLYLPPGHGVPQRVHGAFVDDHEVHNVVNDLKRRSGEPSYDDSVLNGFDEDSGGGAFPGDPFAPAGSSGGDAESDPLYDQALKIVTETRKASVSGVQRRLKIGYNRAARMVEDMETAGVVGPLQSNGQREVLAPPPIKD